jgi:hypothetical protein
MKTPTRKLRVMEATGIERTVDTPPVLVATPYIIDFLRGNCGTVLLHADDDQVHYLFIPLHAVPSQQPTAPLSRGPVRSSGCDAVCLRSIFTGT